MGIINMKIMMFFLNSWFNLNLDKETESKIVIAILTAALTLLVTRVFPYLYNKADALLSWIGKKFGGQFAFRSFRKLYLNEVVVQNKGLNLTGIVSTDDKKPLLEQIYVSLRVSQKDHHEKPLELVQEFIKFKGSVYGWSELREIIKLTEYDKKEKGKLVDQQKIVLVQSSRSGQNNIRLQQWKQIVRKIKRFTSRRLQAVTVNRLNAFERVGWIRDNIDLFKDVMGNICLKYILKRNDKIAILGAPGAGKTTLLQYIALTYARERCSDRKLHKKGQIKKRFGAGSWRLPILLRLSTVAGLLADYSDKNKDASIVDILHRILSADLQSNKTASKFFRHYLEKGKCIVLLDGLDEVPTNSEFQAVAKAINSLCIRYPQNQFIITSRVAGYRGGVNGDFNTFHVDELSDAQIATFVDTWYDAVEKNIINVQLKHEGHSDRKAREKRVVKRSNDLKLTLKQNVGIRRLATNPMLLSIIAVVHRSLATLPRERSKLYAQCSKILLEQWDISRGVRVDDTNLKLEQKEAIIRRIAIALHTGEIGITGGGRDADKDEVLRIMTQILPNLGRPAEDAVNLLKILIERSGIIIERQRGKLSFAHLTFQEYFSAQYLTLVDTDLNKDFLLNPERLLSDWWREVILLYSGQLADSSNFIKSIIHPDTDDLLQARLRLAIFCLDESIAMHNIELRRTLLAKLLRVKFGKIPENFNDFLYPEINDYLIQWSKSEHWPSFAVIAKVNECITQESAQYIYRHLLLILNSQQSIHREAALEAFNHIQPSLYCDRLIDKLFILLLDSNETIRVKSSNLLVLIGQQHQSAKIITGLLHAVAEPKNANESIFLSSLELLKDYIIPSTENFLNVERILRVPDWTICKKGLMALPWISNSASEQLIGNFLDNIQDVDPGLYLRVIGAMGNIGGLRKEYVQSLILKFLENKTIFIALKITIAEVNQIYLDNELILNKLYSLYLEGSHVHRRIAKLILNINPNFNSFLGLLLNIRDRYLQSMVVEILIELDDKMRSKVVLDSLFKIISSNGYSQKRAVVALRIFKNSEYYLDVIQKLFSLTKHKKTNVRIEALLCLARYVGKSHDEEIVQAITLAMEEGSFTVRAAAVNALYSLINKISRGDLTIYICDSISKVLSQIQKYILFKGGYSIMVSRMHFLLFCFDKQVNPERSLDFIVNIKDVNYFEYVFGQSGNYKNREIVLRLQEPAEASHVLKIISREIPEKVMCNKIQNALNGLSVQSISVGLCSLYILREQISMAQFENSILYLIHRKDDYYRSYYYPLVLKIAKMIYVKTKSKDVLDAIKKQLLDDDSFVQESAWNVLKEIHEAESVSKLSLN